MPCVRAAAGARGPTAISTRAVSLTPLTALALHPTEHVILLSAWLWPPKSRMAAFGVQAMWCADVCGYVKNSYILCLILLVGLSSSYKVNTHSNIYWGRSPCSLWHLQVW